MVVFNLPCTIKMEAESFITPQSWLCIVLLPAFSRTNSKDFCLPLSSTRVALILQNGLDMAKLTLTCNFCHHFYQSPSDLGGLFPITKGHKANSGVTFSLFVRNCAQYLLFQPSQGPFQEPLICAQWNQSLVFLVLSTQTETGGRAEQSGVTYD